MDSILTNSDRKNSTLSEPSARRAFTGGVVVDFHRVLECAACHGSLEREPQLEAISYCLPILIKGAKVRLKPILNVLL